MRRVALTVLVVSVGVSALVGIVSLILGDFGAAQVKVLLTSLCVTGASILAMACGAALDKARNRAVPRAGIVLAIVGFALVIVLLWAEEGHENAWKAAATLLIFATSAAHASLLSLARLRHVHAWIRIAAVVSNVVLALFLATILWGEIDEEGAWRAIGVLTILLCAFTILVPVVQRFGKTKALPAAPRPAGEAARIHYCPRCRAKLDLPAGPATCRACGAHFRVDYASAGSSSSSSSAGSDSPSS